MPLFPRIQSPCPYKSRLGEVMDGDFCRMCKRSVVNLDPFSDEERVAFLAGCEEEVCVSYSLPVRRAVAAAALAAMALPAAAAAQEAPAAEVATDVAAEQALDQMAPEDMEIFVGGIKDPSQAQFASDPADLSLPELPVEYEDAPAPAPAAQPAVSSPGGA